MATQDKIDAGGGVNLQGITALLTTLFGPGDTTQKQTSTTSQSGGDLEALKQVFAAMKPGLSADGSTELVQTLFRKGLEGNLPEIFAANNAAGIRSGTTAELLKNDLTARLSGEALTRLSENQARAGQVGAAIAANSPRTSSTTTVNKTKGEGLLANKNALLSGAALLLNSLFNNNKKKSGDGFQRTLDQTINDNSNMPLDGRTLSYSAGSAGTDPGNFMLNPAAAFAPIVNPNVTGMLTNVFSGDPVNNLDFQTAPTATPSAAPDYYGSLKNYFYSGDLTDRDAQRSLDDFLSKYSSPKEAYDYLNANSPVFRNFAVTGTNAGAEADQASSGGNLLDSLFSAISGAQNFGPGAGPTGSGDVLQVGQE